MMENLILCFGHRMTMESIWWLIDVTETLAKRAVYLDLISQKLKNYSLYEFVSEFETYRPFISVIIQVCAYGIGLITLIHTVENCPLVLIIEKSVHMWVYVWGDIYVEREREGGKILFNIRKSQHQTSFLSKKLTF